MEIIYENNATYLINVTGEVYFITYFRNAKYPIIPVITFNDDFVSIVSKLGQPNKYEKGILSYDGIEYTYPNGRTTKLYIDISLLDNVIKYINVHEYLK